MSQENVEVVRRAFEFFERGEPPFEVAHPEIRIDNIPESPHPGPYHGHEGLERWWNELADTVPELRLKLEDVIDVDDECLIAMVRSRGGGANANLADHIPSWAVVHWVRDGLVVRVAGYMRKEEALEAVGLAERER